MGIDHLTVVPENLDVESTADEESATPATDTGAPTAPETEVEPDESADGA